MTNYRRKYPYSSEVASSSANWRKGTQCQLSALTASLKTFDEEAMGTPVGAFPGQGEKYQTRDGRDSGKLLVRPMGYDEARAPIAPSRSAIPAANRTYVPAELCFHSRVNRPIPFPARMKTAI